MACAADGTSTHSPRRCQPPPLQVHVAHRLPSICARHNALVHCRLLQTILVVVTYTGVPHSMCPHSAAWRCDSAKVPHHAGTSSAWGSWKHYGTRERTPCYPVRWQGRHPLSNCLGTVAPTAQHQLNSSTPAFSTPGATPTRHAKCSSSGGPMRWTKCQWSSGIPTYTVATSAVTGSKLQPKIINSRQRHADPHHETRSQVSFVGCCPKQGAIENAYHASHSPARRAT